jgi:FAD binding domain
MSSLPSSSNDLAISTIESCGAEDHQKAICSRAFNGRILGPEHYPSVLFQAKSALAVQEAVKYCAANNLKLCIRSGGHNWESSWLQGPTSALLDVGDINSVQVDVESKLANVGPGAKGDSVLQALDAHDLFFPTGHCKGVPVGGFILGGGYGIGFCRYGMASMLVTAVDAVLADGTMLTASSDSNDPKQQAIMKLLRGSYSGFPGVITNYTLGPLPVKPKGVMSGMLFYKLQDWPKAIKLGKSIALEGDDDKECLEITGIITYAPPPIQEQTGESMVTMLAIMIWADTPEQGRALWQKYIAGAEGCLVPPGSPSLVDAVNVPNSDPYPNARYQTQVFLGNQALGDEAELETVMEPVVDMWTSASKPPPPSHTLLICVPSNLKSKAHGNRDLAVGFTPDFAIQTYAIYQDANQDAEIQGQLAKAHAKIAKSSNFKTSLVEGNTRQHGYRSGFADGEAMSQVEEWVALLDPNGVFSGCPK